MIIRSSAISALVALLVVSNVAVALVALSQGKILHNVLAPRLDDIGEPDSALSQIPEEPLERMTTDFEVINENVERSFPYQLTFAHKCNGEVKFGDVVTGGVFGTDRAAYCVGANQLSVTPLGKSETIIATVTSTSVEDAPILLATERVAHYPESGVIIDYVDSSYIISFDVYGCTVYDDCGVGISYAPTYVYDVAENAFRAISHYPGRGTPIWNNAGTKALFPVVQVGGAGCDDGSLVGYDLVNDTTKALTTEVGCEFQNGNATDVEGNPYPEWGPTFWTSNDSFVAVLLGADNVWKQINGIF